MSGWIARVRHLGLVAAAAAGVAVSIIALAAQAPADRATLLARQREAVTAANINSDGVPGNSSALDQDFALVAYNTCGTTPPTLNDVAATVAGNNRVQVAWTNNTATCATDNNSCTNDVCAAGECTHAALADGAACTDISAGKFTAHWPLRGRQYPPSHDAACGDAEIETK